MVRPWSWIVWLATAFGVFACTKPSTGVVPRAVPKSVNCKAVQPQVEPELMAWDPSFRADLDKLRKQQVVAVRYESKGCDVTLELLSHCIGPKNKYVYSPTSASQTKVANDLNELFVQLPLGASNVMDLMKDKHALRTDLKVVGSVALPEGTKIAASDFLGPECKSATHVISAVYVGGFAMAAGPGPELTKNLFDLATPRDGMTREGYAQICQRAEAEGIELGGCSVPLRLALLPFDTTTPPIEVAARKPFTPSEPAGTQPGVFDQNAIERIVRDRHGIVKRKCWDLAGASIRRVDVTVIATISLQGKVTKAEPQLVDSEGAPDLAATVSRCVAQEVETWSFPQPDRERSVNLPFHLIRQ